MSKLLKSILLTLLAANTKSGQAPSSDGDTHVQQASRPFVAGERLDYEVRFGRLRVGHGTMLLAGLDTVNGRPTWRAIFTVSGGTLFFHVRDSTVSWFDTSTFNSLRFVQKINEGHYHADREFRIYPESATYSRNGKPAVPSVGEPLDDESFIYFLRTLPLEIGRTYRFDRYFQPEGNPIIIRVLRHEAVRVPAGAFESIVVQPQITTAGIFSQHGRAQVWIADDSTHRVLQIKSSLSFGSLNLYLTRASVDTARQP